MKIFRRIEIPDSLSERHSTFVIKEQMEESNRLLAVIASQVKDLEAQLSGRRALDPASESFLQDLRTSRVPPSWQSRLDFSTANIDQYLARMKQYFLYFRSLTHSLADICVMN